ncbi:MAG: hypothetical protein IJX68_08215 [Rikenellaceae bacterium]|nr:hypothetical protein [Rikenellaceae bacterium]
MMTGIVVDASTGDLMVDRGELVMGETSQQVIEHALRAFRGEYREQPLIGAEADKQRNSVGSRLWCVRAKQMCKACGVTVAQVSIEDNNTIVVR